MAKDQTASEFLLQRYAEDDDLMGLLEPGVMHDGLGQSWKVRHLADNAAKRRIVELHGGNVAVPGWCPICATPDETRAGLRYEDYPCATLLALAQPYANHAEFRDEWWPDDQELEKARWRFRKFTSWLQGYEGLQLEQAIERAQAERRTYQVIGPDTIITTHLRNDRLNLTVDADGNLIGMSAG